MEVDSTSICVVTLTFIALNKWIFLSLRVEDAVTFLNELMADKEYTEFKTSALHHCCVFDSDFIFKVQKKSILNISFSTT